MFPPFFVFISSIEELSMYIVSDYNLEIVIANEGKFAKFVYFALDYIVDTCLG